VYEAYKAVKSNKGAAGVDGQTIELFDADLEGNLYKIWNRMSTSPNFTMKRSMSSPARTSLGWKTWPESPSTSMSVEAALR
jgi:hypothetical protein